MVVGIGGGGSISPIGKTYIYSVKKNLKFIRKINSEFYCSLKNDIYRVFQEE